MPHGDEKSYFTEQKRQGSYPGKSDEHRGVSDKKAGERAWRTVKQKPGGVAKKKKAPARR